MEQQNFMQLWQRAANVAAIAHRQQYRRNGVTPYFAHPVRVALTLVHVFGCDDEQIIAAALLHDVIEDTTVDYDDLIESFGSDVADMVAALSKDSRLIESEREAAYDRQLQAASSGAKLIKLADVYDNLCDKANVDELRKTLTKAERALAIADQDPTLAEPMRIVSALCDDMRQRMQTAL